jgi:hypothetical protein
MMKGFQEVKLAPLCFENQDDWLKSNFSNQYGNEISCRICKVHIECQEHLLQCEVFKSKVENPNQVVYEDIFGHVDKQLEAVRVFKKVLRETEVFLHKG